jgi:CubicO group peptidase (beta-lactamase class C family)
MKWIKVVFRSLAIALAFVVLLSVGLYLSDPAYWQRLVTAPMGEVWRVEWYQPQERVAGAPREDLPSGEPDTRLARLLPELEREAVADGTVGLILWHQGAIRYEFYGEGYDRNTRTETSSAHKSVVALLTGAAIQDGLLRSVDQPAADFLPEWTDEARGRIQLRHLLTMSSGLEVITAMNPAGRGMRLMLGDDIPPIVLGLAAETEPGRVFEYVNANPQLLGMILSRASGKRYADYLAERLWQRIGASDAFLWLDRAGGTPRTFCCLMANGRDWLRIGVLLLQRGRFGDDQIVPEAWVADMLTPSPANPNYGYLTWLGSPPGRERIYNSKNPFKAIHSEAFAAPDVAFIDGFGGQRVYVVPSQELVIVRTGRADLQWDDAALPNRVIRALQSEATP